MNMVQKAQDATGNSLPATLLLLRIEYWTRITKLVRDGKTWVVKTGAQWMEETRLTAQQYKDAIALLKKRGIIETCCHMWRGFRTTFLRLATPTDWCPEALYGQGLETPTHIEESLDKEIKKELLVNEQETGPMDNPEKPGKTVTKPNTFKVPGATASDIKTMFSEAKAKPKEDKSPPDLKLLWQMVMKEQTGILYSVTMKDLGQLKHCRNKLPEGKGTEILTYVLGNWNLFVEEVKMDNGWKHGPTVPSIGYLLKHINSAHSLWHRKTQKKITPANPDSTKATVKIPKASF